MAAVKGVKVWSRQASGRRIGIAAESLCDLKHKIQRKFYEELNKSEVFLFLQDGTEIDDEDYFTSLDNQEVLYVSNAAQFSPLEASDSEADNPLEDFLSTLRQQNGYQRVIEQIRELLDNNEKWRQMHSFISSSMEKNTHKTILSSRQEDPEWFQDLSTNAQTKEEFLRKGCQARIRGYLAKAEAGIKAGMSDYEELLTTWREWLKQSHYNGHYFDRKSQQSDRICDDNGWFHCEGRFDEDNCKYAGKLSEEIRGDEAHSINPYSSNEARILFSTWNLDHVIERSRTIVPTLINAVKQRPKSKEINANYFYNLLFTRDNLKFVHIVCHDKQEHSSKKCDTKLIYLPFASAKSKQRKRKLK